MAGYPTLAFSICWLFVIGFVGSVSGAGNPSIIVVGAGAAGISAASRLYQNGLKNIIILEASSRLGGRIRTTPFGSGSGIVELGAQWCHGEQGNVVYQLAKVYPGLLKSSIIADEDAVLIRSSGVQVPGAVAERLQTMAEEIIDSDARDTFSGSLGEFFTQQYWKRLQTDPAFKDISRELAEQFLVYYHNYERGYTAYDSWYDVAAAESDSYVEPAGNQDIAWNGKRGFTAILDIVSGNYPGNTNKSLTPVPIGSLVKFNNFVSNINWMSPEGDVFVTTQNGDRYQADHVIVTVSLGVLKENYRTMFTPALPSVNQNAITGLYFGTVNKIFVYFDAPIPEDFPNTVHLLWYKPDLQALRLSEHAWAEAISTFFRIDNQPNVLMAWMNGAEGRKAEYLRDAPIKSGILHLLKIFAKNMQFGNVLSILRSKWSSDRLFRGSYSSRSMATENQETGAQFLATPLKNALSEPVVLFAGEATNRVHYSTVHGAIDSGFREANRLIRLYK